MRIALSLYTAGLLALAAPAIVHADPPVDPPCDLDMDRVFCVECVDFNKVPGFASRYQIELAFLNWTTQPAYGVQLFVGASGIITGIKPTLVGASIDANGRPIGPGSVPIGPFSVRNDWDPLFASFGADYVSFGVGTSGTPIPNATATVGGVTYNGLKDPLFASLTETTCAQVVGAMIPGSVLSEDPNPFVIDWKVSIPDPRTIDDGPNVRDGFVIEIDDWDPGEELSFNWYLFDLAGTPIGKIDGLTSVVTGDEFGFGVLNFTVDAPKPPGAGFPPKALYKTNSLAPSKVNTGYSPENNSNPSADSPLYFAEEEDPVTGIDLAPFNPIPANEFGFGHQLYAEAGALITGQFFNPSTAPAGVGVNAFPFETFEKYGSGCAGSAGVPSLSGTGFPNPGGSINVALSMGVPFSGAVLFLGLQQASQSLPGPGGCSLLLAGLFPAPISLPLDANGSVTLVGGIPPTAPTGVVLLQGFTIDSGVPQGYAASNGLILSITP